MTPSPSCEAVAGLVSPPSGDGPPERDGLGPTAMWFIAICHRCNADFGQPFGTEDERDVWAAAHVAGTGHTVQLLVEVAHTELSGHTTAMIRVADGQAGWLCTATPCERWNGPYASPQVAIASFREHRKDRRS